jgi:hypothetical protein
MRLAGAPTFRALNRPGRRFYRATSWRPDVLTATKKPDLFLRLAFGFAM